LQLAEPQHDVRHGLAGGIFANQKLVGIGGGLVVAAPEAITHLGVQFAHGDKRIGHFHGVRSDQVNAFVGDDDTFVVGQRAFLLRLFVERGTHFLCAGKLRAGGFAFGGGVAGRAEYRARN